MRGKLGLVPVLLRAGADPSICDKAGRLFPNYFRNKMIAQGLT